MSGEIVMPKFFKFKKSDTSDDMKNDAPKAPKGYGVSIDASKLDKLKSEKGMFGIGKSEAKQGFSLSGVATVVQSSDSPEADIPEADIDADVKSINTAKGVKQVPALSLDMGKYKYAGAHKNSVNVKLIIGAGLFLMLFCAIMLTGVVYTSAVFSKAITESAITEAADAVRMINESTPKPVSSLDLDSAAKAANTLAGNEEYYLGAIRNRYDEFVAATKAKPDEIKAFDAMISYAVGKSQNPIIQSVFSATDQANLQYAADGYNVWAYINDVKKKSGIDFDAGTALLEAAALVRYSHENNIPLSLAVGVAQTESAFNPGAYSNKAACGPMQVVYDIHTALLNSINIKKKDELFTADRGVQAGCYLLGRYLKAEGSVTGGLKRYYGALSSNYINKVLSHRHAFELYASGIEKDVASAVKKEDVNWAKMGEAKVPVYKASSAPAKKTTAAPAKRQASGNKGLTIKPDSSTRRDSQAYYKNTGTIVISRPDGSTQKFDFKE